MSPSKILCDQFVRCCIWAILVLALSSCAVTNRAMQFVGLGSNNSLRNIEVESVANSNINTPVAIDIVFVYDSNITSILSELTGPDWFAQRRSLLKRYDKEIELLSLEVVPLSYVDNIVLPDKHKQARDILLFANYRTIDGQYMAKLSQFKRLKVRLLRDAYQLIEEG